MTMEEIATGGGILLAAMTLIQIAPIKLNPWSALAKAIGRAINGEVITKVDRLERELHSIITNGFAHGDKSLAAKVNQFFLVFQRCSPGNTVKWMTF